MNQEKKYIFNQLFLLKSNVDFSSSFKFGSFVLASKYKEIFPKGKSLFEIKVKLEKNANIKKRVKGLDFRQPYYYFFFSEKENILWYNRPFLKTKMYVLIKNPFSNPTIYFNNIYDKWSNLRTSKVPTIGVIVGDLANLLLISHGYTMVHGATLANNKETILISGLPDTGKTLTATNLTKRNYYYLGDDITILNKRGEVFAVPFTLTSNQNIPLRSKLLNKIFKYDNLRKGVLDIHKEVKIKTREVLKRVYFIELARDNSFKEMRKEEAALKLFLHNRLEFTYPSNPFLLSLFYFLNKDLSAVLEKEKKIIFSALGGVKIYNIKGKNSIEISNLIKEIETKNASKI